MVLQRLVNVWLAPDCKFWETMGFPIAKTTDLFSKDSRFMSTVPSARPLLFAVLKNAK